MTGDFERYCKYGNDIVITENRTIRCILTDTYSGNSNDPRGYKALYYYGLRVDKSPNDIEV